MQSNNAFGIVDVFGPATGCSRGEANYGGALAGGQGGFQICTIGWAFCAEI